MVNQNKIILMSKIAVYEKRYKRRDERVMNYFVEDYVYMRNFATRLGISLITACFIGLGAFQIIVNDIIFPHSMEHFIAVYVSPYIIPWLIGIVVYTCISTAVYSARYRIVSKRFYEYKRLVRELKKYDHGLEQEEAINEI